MSIRKAFLFSAVDRYATLVLSFTLIASMSRLLSPEEIGISVIGATISAFADILSDVPSTYLVQKETLERDNAKTAFTLMLLISTVMAISLAVAAPFIAETYHDHGITFYLQLISLGFVLSSVERPLMALFRREMNFKARAIVNVVTVASTSAVTLVLALLGFSYLSFAWGALAGGIACNIAALYLKPDFGIFRWSLAGWQTAIKVTTYVSFRAILFKVAEIVPYFVLGRYFPLAIIGFYHRMTLVNSLPDRLVMSGLSPVIFPAFATQHREGLDLKPVFLLSATYTCAVMWPASILLAIFAGPAVRLLLGPQWLEVVPLVRISSLAYLFYYPASLAYPILIAIGAMRPVLVTTLILPFSIAATAYAASWGLEVLAFSLFITIPVQAALNVAALRLCIQVQWVEIAKSLKSSFLVTIAACAVPIAGIAVRGFRFDLPIWYAAILGLGAAGSWLYAINLTDHPLKQEIDQRIAYLRQRLQAGTEVRAA